MSKNILVINTERSNEPLYKDRYLMYAENRGYNLKFTTFDISEHDFSWLKKWRFKHSHQYRERLYQELSKSVENIVDSYDYVLVLGKLDHEGVSIFSEGLLNKFQSKKARMVFTHDMQDMLVNVRTLGYFEKVLSVEKRDIGIFKEKHNIDIGYCPRSTSYLLFPKYEDKRNIDVCFVGVVTPKRMQYIEAVAKYCKENKRKFWLSGHFWNTSHWWIEKSSKHKFVKKYPYSALFAKSMYLMPRDLAKIYSKTKICLNINLQEHSSLNTRILDAMACKSVVISDYQDTEGEDLQVDKHFRIVNSPKQMVELVDYYLKHETESYALADRGYDVVERSYRPYEAIDRILFS